MIIYNLFPLLAGPITGWQSHFTRARSMGFDWVFVNPIQRTGSSGSLYSIADYFDYNPLLIDPDSDRSAEDQVRAMLAQAEGLGLAMMTDLVVNHCAFDSPILHKHPDWFKWEGGAPAHPSCVEGDHKVVWGDLIQFDHDRADGNPELYRHFLGVTRHLIGLGFRGFRCDAAYQIPAPFWRRLIAEVKTEYPNVQFVAETLGCTPEQTVATASAGFDFIFNSAKWWDYGQPWLLEQHELTRRIAPSIAFPESHDTLRLAAELDGNLAGIRQRHLFTALFSAGVMMPVGFEFGFRKPLHVVDTRPSDWETPSSDLTGFVGAVNRLKRENPIFHEENAVERLEYRNPGILIMRKTSLDGKQEALLLLNRDCRHHQEFWTDHFRHFVKGEAPLRDVSPEFALDYLPHPFHYSLQPGQGIVLITP